jgi:Leucine-rich repeat (LRR) protein
LKKLQKLELMFLGLMSFPAPGLDDLQQLEVLNLTGCPSLKSLPASFGSSVQSLATLDLSGCSGLLSLPELDGLPQLLTLKLDECFKLQLLPASFGRAGGFLVLKHLSMCCCRKVASFPELKPGAMPQLVYLDLKGWVQLRNVPESLANLTTLLYLSFSRCTHLQSLEHNSFCFQKLPNLEELDFEKTEQLAELPASFGSLYNLRKLNIRGCPASIPEEVEFMIQHRRIEIVK